MFSLLRLLFRWLNDTTLQSRIPAQRCTDTGELILRYSPAAQWMFMIVTVVLVCMLTLASVVQFMQPSGEENEDADAGGTIFLVLALTMLSYGVYLFWLSRATLVIATESHISVEHPPLGRITIPWPDVNRITFTISSNLIIRGPQGQIRLSPYLGGLVEVESLLYAKLPAEVKSRFAVELQEWSLYLRGHRFW